LRITTAAGNESIELVTGERLRYVARSKDSGRGFTAGKVILDEAYALSGEEMGALLPTLATMPAAQVVYTSSAGRSSSAVLRSVRDRGRAGGDPSLGYAEWGGVGSCAAGVDCRHRLDDPACALNDRRLWAAANPRVPLDFIAKERRALASKPDEFARERLGWWDEPGGESPISAMSWQARADPSSRPLRRPVALALDTSKGLRAAAVVAAGRRADGRLHAEVLRAEDGVHWLRDFLRTKTRELGCAVHVLGGSATAQAVMPDLDGIRVVELPMGDYPAACVAFAADVAADRFRHLGDPLMTDAIAAAGTKPVGDAGAWQWSPRLSSDDIFQLVAMTLALWAIRERPVDYAASVW
jgi:hypothetical protein